MNIPELQGPPACITGLVFKFPLHLTDLNAGWVLIYGVHITHIKLSLAALSLSCWRRSQLWPQVAWIVEPSSRQQGVKTRRERLGSGWNVAVFGSLSSDKSGPTPSFSHERIKRTWEDWRSRDL